MNRNVVFSCFSMVLASSAAMSEPREAGPRSAVNAFYKAFNNGFVEPADYATGDWNHIPPNGRRFNGLRPDFRHGPLSRRDGAVYGGPPSGGAAPGGRARDPNA